MTRRATFTKADLDRLEKLAERARSAGMRLELEVDGRKYVADPRAAMPASRPESDVDRWMRENGYDQG